MTDKEKIRAEIERMRHVRYMSCGDHAFTGRERMFILNEYEVLGKVLGFIDSLPEEPVSEDLEEAARKAATWHSKVEGEQFIWNDYHKFIAGAQWQKQQIIDKACEWLKEQDEMIGVSFEEDFIGRFKDYMK